MVSSYRRTDPSPDDLPRGMLVVAAVLTAAGSLLGLAGVAVAAAAAWSTAHRWYRRTDLPASDLARLKWEQARAAAAAGSGAWRDTELAKYSPRGEQARS
ncbi:hypothetical protein ACL02T_05840 [Pseudonocardia sp. RS010]|uniref:hypothetical protein n=1 Tax=Pseudonocardia sp. RS010 TaxID=3385979 RepID=UPI0039A041FA